MSRGFRISKNKAIEVELSHWAEWQWFDFRVKVSRACDHAGLEIHLEILGIYFTFLFHDVRHWDYDNGCWRVYPEVE